MNYLLNIHLLSDTLAGRGDGVAGLVDTEIENEAATGLPYIKGKTVKGLLVEECANIFYALTAQNNPVISQFERAARYLFGYAKSTEDSFLYISSARFPEEIRKVVHQTIVKTAEEKQKLTRMDILNSLTEVRRQTAMDSATGTPDHGSLRAIRVLVRGLTLTSDLIFRRQPIPDASLPLLAACARSLQRMGGNRTRGLGRIHVTLASASQPEVDITPTQFDAFKALIMKQEVHA